MSKSELKAAMAALEVSKPLKLKQTIVFEAPQAPVSFQEVQSEEKNSQQNQEIENEDTQDFEGGQETRVPHESRASLGIKGTQESRVPTKSKAAQDCRGTQNSKGTLKIRVASQTNKPSKREVILRDEKGEPMCVNKKDLPACELVKFLNLSEEGYGSLTNRILEILYQADFDKAEHEIIQFIIRESIFWRQEWTDPLSGADFERLSGISNSSLWTHLKRLTERGWLEKELVKVYGQSQARNRYRLNPTIWGPLLPKKRKDTQDFEGTPKTGGTQDSGVKDTQKTRGATTSENQSGSSLYKNNLLKKDIKTSLSQAPLALQERWSRMIDHGKQEREIFLFLLQTYGRPVWDHCFDVVDYLKAHGDLRKNPVGSPFGLLAQGNNWEVFLGLTLARKSKAQAVQAAREALPQSMATRTQKPSEEEPKTPPPAEFLSFLNKKRGPSSAMRVFEGQFVDMEAAFQRRFHTKAEQWAEIHSQLGVLANSIEHEKAKWITGIQRWFRSAWDKGEIAC